MYACLSLGVLSAQLVRNDSACKIPEDEWLRMYHYIMAKWELAKRGSFLTAASLMILIGPHDYDIADATDVGALKRSIVSSIGGEITDRPNIPKDADNLSGKFRKGTTVLITDLRYTKSALQQAPMTSAWAYRTWDGRSRCSRSMSRGIRRHWRSSWTQYTMDKSMAFLKEKSQEGDVTVYIWLSLQFVLGQNPPYLVLVDNHFAERLTLRIVELDLETTRPIFVAVCPSSEFNDVEGKRERIAQEFESGLRGQNILVSTPPQMWRATYSQFGHQFKMLKKKKKETARHWARAQFGL